MIWAPGERGGAAAVKGDEGGDSRGRMHTSYCGSNLDSFSLVFFIRISYSFIAYHTIS